jgi:hypothetical protein
VDDTIRELDLNLPQIKANFEEYLGEIDLHSKIRIGSLVKGPLKFSRNSQEEASVISQFGFEVKVIGV